SPPHPDTVDDCACRRRRSRAIQWSWSTSSEPPRSRGRTKACSPSWRSIAPTDVAYVELGRDDPQRPPGPARYGLPDGYQQTVNEAEPRPQGEHFTNGSPCRQAICSHISQVGISNV